MNLRDVTSRVTYIYFTNYAAPRHGIKTPGPVPGENYFCSCGSGKVRHESKMSNLESYTLLCDSINVKSEWDILSCENFPSAAFFIVLLIQITIGTEIAVPVPAGVTKIWLAGCANGPDYAII